jgi:hypothetical protein
MPFCRQAPPVQRNLAKLGATVAALSARYSVIMTGAT